MAEAWSVGAHKPRNLVFHAFTPRRPELDEWIPLSRGDFAEVQEVARLHAAAHGTRCLVIALSIDATAPVGLSEKALLRLGRPWY